MPPHGVQNSPLHAPLLNQNVEGGNAAPAAPAALGHASAARTAGRVVACILTFGISEGIRAIVHHCRAAGAHEAPAPQAAPALAQPHAEPQTDFDNGRLADSLRTLDPQSEHGQAIREGLDAVRDAFPGMLPEGDTLLALGQAAGNRSIEYELKGAVRKSDEEVTPQVLSRLTQETARSKAAYAALTAEIRSFAQSNGLAIAEDRLGWIASALRTRHPEEMGNLSRFENITDLRAALEPLRDELLVLARRESDCAEALAEARDDVFRSVARATGLPEDQVRNTLNMTSIDDTLPYIRKDMRDEANAAPDPAVSQAEFRAAFSDRASRFAAQKNALYASIDGLALSPELKADWKREVLGNITLKSDFFLQKCDAVAGRMDAPSLLRALREPSVTEQEILGLLKSLYAQLDTYSHEAFTPQEFDRVGSDELSCMSTYALQAFLDKNPEVVAELRSDPARLTSLQEAAQNDANHTNHLLIHDFDSPIRRMEHGFSSGAMMLLRAITPSEED